MLIDNFYLGVGFVINILLSPLDGINYIFNWFDSFQYISDFFNVIAFVIPWGLLFPLLSIILSFMGLRVTIALIKFIRGFIPTLGG